MREQLEYFENKKRRDVQREEDAKVFTDFGTNEKIAHYGFDSISSFDEAIRNLKSELKSYNDELENLLNEVLLINEKLDVLNRHPEDDITNSIERFKFKKDEIKERVVFLKDKILKEEKNLSELEFARKEFLKNTRLTYKNDTKNRISLLDEYDQKQKEVKNLEAKIYMGNFNDFDKERLGVLKNSIIPDLEKLLKREKLDEADKVNEEKEMVSSSNSKSEEHDDEQSVNKSSENEIANEMLKSEKRKRVIKKGVNSKISKLIDSKPAKVIMAVAASATAIALFMINPALALTAGAGAFIANQYNKGKKL